MAATSRQCLVAIVFVVFVAPVALCVPTMIVFIPPAVIGAPAMLACFMQVMARVVGLRTAIAMVLDGLMQSVIGFCDSMLARCITISAHIWGRAEYCETDRCRCDKRRPSKIMWQSCY
jgi:hypothetical protein